MYAVRTKNSQNTCLEKYGEVSAAKLEITQQKLRNTELKKYGSETFNNRSQSKNTLLNDYGVENISQIQSVKDKKKESNEQKMTPEEILIDAELQLDRKKEEELNDSHSKKSASTKNIFLPFFYNYPT